MAAAEAGSHRRRRPDRARTTTPRSSQPTARASRPSSAPPRMSPSRAAGSRSSLHPPPPAPAPASSSAAAVAARSPARDHGHHSSDLAEHTSPSPNGAGPDAAMLLQWGHNKRSRGRRDAPASSTPAPPPMTPAQVRRQAALKIQRRHSAAAAGKLMPPPSTRGSNLRVTSSLPSRAAADAHHGRTAALPHHRSVEERAVGQVSAAAATTVSKQQRQASDKAPHKVDQAAPEQPKHQMVGSGSGSGHHQAEPLHGAGPSSKPPAAASAGQKHELPRIYTTLSRKEKEEDFLAMKGTKLPQRPKKRPKLVDKAVSYICPGMWLTEVTRSRYEVREKKCAKKQKRRGGLKGMESSDSD